MGGPAFFSEAERLAHIKRFNEEKSLSDKQIAWYRQRLAKKIVMMITDTIVNDIIRPGPVAEERECYDMAEELRNHKEKISEIVLAILNVEDLPDRPKKTSEYWNELFAIRRNDADN